MLKRRLKNQPIGADHNQSPSLKQRALRGSAWTFGGQGTSQILRLGGNLLLTRLLFPEAFGLMGLVQAFMTGLELFSDVGIYPSIIQNKRGNDPAFLNTAWTIQMVRGVALWILCCLIAWPVAQFYREPMIVQLLPVAGLSALIAGLNSTKLATSNRQLTLGRLTLVELGSYALGLTVMIVWAWIYQSVWALVGGGIVNALSQMILSHIFLEGEQNRFHWDPEAFKEIHQFGRWIFFSTALTFIAGYGDRLVLGRLLDISFLGVYAVALMMARVISENIIQVGSRVLFPSFAELVRDHPERLYSTLRRCRLMLIALSWSASLFFIIFGKELISFLYDDRYVDAGWMLQTLPLGGLVGVLSLTYDNVLLAKGQVFAITILLAFQIGVQLTAMFLGFEWGGQQGVVVGLATVAWITYPLKAFFLVRLSLWQPEIDLPLIALASGVAAIVFFN